MSRADADSALGEYIRTTCLDNFEGCACGLPKGHGPEVLHLCASVGCGTTWTDEQSAAWWIEFKREMAEMAAPRDHEEER